MQVTRRIHFRERLGIGAIISPNSPRKELRKSLSYCGCKISQIPPRAKPSSYRGKQVIQIPFELERTA
ncbi:hypothetical protein Mal52_30880 [Symmachiella dynata]|uniref:Uncharacterized protein n=1 Tax=Symmachiella dynata TaxID=2527995 RepID=A0A517ZQ41_9PLAN|nr:hypothetical protein Mal52_30880 [Symmachiella dynata]